MSVQDFDFHAFVGRIGFGVQRSAQNFSTLRCPEVRLEFRLRGVQRSVQDFDFDVFVGRIGFDLRGTARRQEDNSLESSTSGRASRGEGEIQRQQRYPEKENMQRKHGVIPGLRVLIICNIATGENLSKSTFSHFQKTHENPPDFNTFSKPMLWPAFGAHFQPWCSWFSLLACPSQKTHENPIDFNNS